ncbi:MAG: nucleoside transporter C-terminal domain-containing protein [Bdellovibrionota bacterium]
MERITAFFGIFIMMLLAWLISDDRKKMDWRVIGGGLLLQLLLALLFLKTPMGSWFFGYAKDAITHIINLSDEGAIFLFGEGFREHFFAFKILPTIIFVSSISYLFFYWGIIQKFVKAMALIMNRMMNISGTEALVSAANIFCGQTESPLFIKPYLKTMTKSEIMTMMTSGMATAAGGVLAAYVGFGVSAGHLLAASLMSAPAAIIIARIIYPEKEHSVTKGSVSIDLEIKEVNAFDAACKGASEGLLLCLNVGAMLIAFTALVAFANLILAKLSGFIGTETTVQGLFAYLFQPLAFFMGIPWEESYTIGKLLGEKTVINEFIAYVHLGDEIKAGTLSQRTIDITTYALCGFANFSSVAIQIGGIGALVPEKKDVFAEIALKAMIGGTLAAFMTACFAGMLL